MREPRRLTTVSPSTACCTDYCTFYQLKHNADNNYALHHRNLVRRCSAVVMDGHCFPHNVRMGVTLVARLLLSPVAQKLCRWEQDVFRSRTCARCNSTTVGCLGCVCNHSSATVVKMKFSNTRWKKPTAILKSVSSVLQLMHWLVGWSLDVHLSETIQKVVTFFLQISEAGVPSAWRSLPRTKNIQRRTCWMSLTLPVCRNHVTSQCIVAFFVTSFFTVRLAECFANSSKRFYVKQRSRMNSRSAREYSTFAGAELLRS
jgi:hypothetical protein